jgi:hypothetical protein
LDRNETGLSFPTRPAFIWSSALPSRPSIACAKQPPSARSLDATDRLG